MKKIGAPVSRFFGERTKRKGVWLVVSLDVKEFEWPVGRSLRLEERALSLPLGSWRGAVKEQVFCWFCF